MYPKAGGATAGLGTGLAATGVHTLWLLVAGFTLIGVGIAVIFMAQPTVAGLFRRRK